MRTVRFLLVIGFVLGTAASHIPAQQIQPPETRLEQVDAYVAQVMRDWEVPGLALAIVQGDSVLMAKGYGVQSLESERAVDEHTRFAIASNSKAFTTACLAILVDEGKLHWDDPVTRYLPEFQMPDPYVTRELTLRDLVCHRSGMDTFSGDLLWYDTTYSADDIIKRIRHLKPVSSFRSQYGYQNLMYITAGKVIEAVAGMSWAEFVKKRILEPVGMQETTTTVLDLKTNFASPHNRSGRRQEVAEPTTPAEGTSSSPPESSTVVESSTRDPLRVLPLGNVDNCWGACGLNSSVSDLSRWLRLQLGRGTLEGKPIFRAERAWEMWQPNTLIPLSENAVARNPTRHFLAYGLGFVVHDYHGRKVIGHSGGLDGMISQLAFVPEEQIGVVVLTNSESPASRILRDRILDLFLEIEELRDWNAEALEAQQAADRAEAERQKQITAARVPGTEPTLPLERLCATFQSELYGDVTVTLEEGQLVMRLIPAPNFVADLEHWHYNTFQIKWRDSVHYDFPRGFANFTIDTAGQPERLVIDQPNNDFWFYELELTRRK